ncbi:MAG TPA: type IV toxin-antitoxin system AbiEi family antitoxin domain-containing protein [Marmoricola sp.]|jgi:hypothetical protein|nr:type IV toxin-antitoxin system AbiEi family antitoxin domain-containing protein [Marmoricola sp.]
MQTFDLPDTPFTRTDLDRLGLTPDRLRRAIDRGQVRRLLRGVYVDVRLPDSIGIRVLAMKTVVSPGHVACDRTAAWLHGIDVLGGGVWTIPPIEVSALRGRPATERGDLHGRNRDLASRDIQEIGGVLVTTPLRTALDLGCVLRRRDALAALDRFRHAFDLTEQQLVRELPRYFRRRGVIQLRELVPLADPRAESVRESWTRLAITDAGLPAPVLQYEIKVDGVVLWRLDLAYPEARVAVEYDGEDFHHTDEQLEHDVRRRAWLARDGWRVVVVRRGDFTGAQLSRWISELEGALRSPYTNLRW